MKRPLLWSVFLLCVREISCHRLMIENPAQSLLAPAHHTSELNVLPNMTRGNTSSTSNPVANASRWREWTPSSRAPGYRLLSAMPSRIATQMLRGSQWTADPMEYLGSILVVAVGVAGAAW